MQLLARKPFEARRWALLSCAQQDALAIALVVDAVILLDLHDDTEPFSVDVVLDNMA